MVIVYVSVINYNNSEDTLACLQSLAKLKIKDFTLHVLVIDNASAHPLTLDYKHYANLSLTLIRTHSNLGFAGGHNMAIRFAIEHHADYILILNNDTVADQNLISELINTAVSDEKIGLVVPKIYFTKGYEYHVKRYKQKELGNVLWYAGGVMDWQNVIGNNIGVDEVDCGQYDTACETDLATGCCMLVRRRVFERIGLFNENYFLYYEDTDFSERAKQAGYRIYYQPKSRLWHKNAGAAGGSGSDLQDYYISRNRLLFGVSHAPLRSKLALMREATSLLKSGRVWQKRGVRDYFLWKLGMGSYHG